jgi:anti-anti-sigma regulatory factor
VVVIEFLTQDIAGTVQARELAEQLESLIRPDLPQNFVMNLSSVRFLGSTAFGAIVSFAHEVGRLHVCTIPESLRLGAALIGLEECALYAPDRGAAIEEARKAPAPGSPLFCEHFNEAAKHAYPSAW